MPATTSKVALLAGAVAAAGAACVGYGVLVERDWYRLRRERVEALAGAAHRAAPVGPAPHGGRRPAAGVPGAAGRRAGRPGRADRGHARSARARPGPGSWAGSGPGWGRWPCSAPTTTGRPGSATRSATSSAQLAPAPQLGPQPVAELVAGLEAKGWTVLSNRRGRLGDVELAGMDDPHIRRDDPEVAVPPNGESPARLGVVHSPYRRALDAFERNGYWPATPTAARSACPGSALVTNCDLPREQVRGLSRGVELAARLGRPRHQQVRPVPLCLPPRGLCSRWSPSR